MNKLFISSAVSFALASTHLAASPIHTQRDIPHLEKAHREEIWLAQGNNGNGYGNDKALKKGHNAGNGNPGNGRGRPEHAGGPKLKTNGKGVEHASQGSGNGANGRRAFTTAEREEIFRRIIAAPAPAGRDMRRVRGATHLALATPQLLVSDIPDEELITYRNCPPGLAKKDPHCVPPGLASKGVTYDEWTSYDHDDYDAIWVERRDEWLRSETEIKPDPELLLLQSDQIAVLFDLDPAPEGQQYALIDGLPVLLDENDYNALLLVNQMAHVPELVAATPMVPTAALAQDELVDLYRLPQPGDDENYAVVNGQVVRLNDSNYELLQMIRVARAVL